MPNIDSDLAQLYGAEDKQTSFSDYLLDVPRGVASGVVGFGQSIGSLADKGAELVGIDLADDSNFTEDALPEWMRTKTVVGGLVDGFTQFGIGMIPAAGILGAAGKAAKASTFLREAYAASKGLQVAARIYKNPIVHSTVQGAVTDLLAFQGNEGRLSDLVHSLGGVGDNVVTRWLSSNKDDSWLEARVKNAVEGAFLNAVSEPIVRGALKAIRGTAHGDPAAIESATKEIQTLFQDPKGAAEAGLIPPELAEKLTNVDWSSEQFSLKGDKRADFEKQLRQSLRGMKRGEDVATATMALSDAFGKLKAAASGKSLDDVYGEMFAGVRAGGELAPDALHQVNPTAPILSGAETLDVKGTNRGNGAVTIEDAAKALERRQRLVQRIRADDYSPKALDELTKDLKTEAMTALENPESAKAIGWYSSQVKSADDKIAKVFPEIKSDPKAAFVFKLVLAVTSNGTDPKLNLRSAANLFEQWLQTGSFVGKGMGIRGSSHAATLQKVQNLVDKLGGDDAAYQDVQEMFTTDMSVREIKKLTGKTVPQESVDAVLKGSMMLGPKVGAFFSNLFGDFSYPTLDSWMYRQFNRIRGNLSVPKAELDAAATKRLSELEKLVADNPGMDLGGLDLEKARTDRKYLREFATTTEAQLSRRDFKNPTPIESWAKSFINSSTPLHESPRGSTEQAFFRSAMMKAAEQLSKERGIDLTTADLQAILWYHEKALYEKLGIKGKSAARVDFSQAADDFARTYERRVRPAAGSADAGAAAASDSTGRRIAASPDHLLQPGTESLPGTRRGVTDAPGQIPLDFFGNAPRGAAQFASDGRALITLFKSADPSTVVHELGHVFRRQLASISPELLTRAEAALGVSFSSTGEALVKAEEAWARSFETYVSRGQAPTEELKSVFAQFKDWLTTVYRSVMGSPLQQEVPPDLRNVFDAMLGKGWNRHDVTAVKPTSRLPNRSSPRVRSIRSKFWADRGGTDLGSHKMVNVDEARAQKIADAYEAMKDDPNNPVVKASYDAMKKETLDQYKLMESQGIKVVPWAGEGEPYSSSQAMIEDVEKNGRLYFLKTLKDGEQANFGDNAAKVNHLLEPAGITLTDSAGKPHEMTYNDVFRAVHDFFGHAADGWQFGPRGEENAWVSHARMYSKEARMAMTQETRGQNSWVNYGKHVRRPDGSIPKKGDPDFVPAPQRPFAEQKSGIFPEEFTKLPEEITPGDLAGEVFDDLAKALDSGLGPDEAVREAARKHINYLRVAGTEGVLRFLRAVESTTQKVIDGRIGQTRSLEEATKMAKEFGENPEAVIATLTSNADFLDKLGPTIVALRNIRDGMARSGEELATNVIEYLNDWSQMPDSLAEDFVLQVQASTEADTLLGVVMKSLSRALGEQRIVTGALSEEVPDAETVLKALLDKGEAETKVVETVASKSAAARVRGEDPASVALRKAAKRAADSGKADLAGFLKAEGESVGDMAKRVRNRRENVDFLRGSGEADATPEDFSFLSNSGEGVNSKDSKRLVRDSRDGTSYTASDVGDIQQEADGWNLGDTYNPSSGENMGRTIDGARQRPRAPKEPGTPGQMIGTGDIAEASLGPNSHVTTSGIVKERVGKLASAMKMAASSNQSARVLRAARNARKAGLTDMFLEYYKASILSGIPTFAVNVLDGAVNSVFLPLSRTLGAALSLNSQEIKDGFRLMAQTVGAAKDMFYLASLDDTRSGFKGLGAVATTIRREQNTLTGQTATENLKAIRGENFGLRKGSVGARVADAAGRFVRLPFTANQTVEEFYQQIHYLSYIRTQALREADTRIWQNASIPAAQKQAAASLFVDDFVKDAFDNMGQAKTVHEDAIRYAKASTRSQDLLYGFGETLMQAKRQHPWLDLFVPFVKAPTNLIRSAVRMTPVVGQIQSGWALPSAVHSAFDRLPVLRGLSEHWKARLASHSRDEVLRARGEMALGTAAWTYFTYLAASGQITGGGPVNPQERAVLMQTGWRPYSLALRGEDGKTSYIEYRRFDPFSTIAGFAADLASASAYMQDDEKDQLATAAILSVANNFSSRTYLKSIADAAKTLTADNRGEAAKKYLQDRVAGLVPNILAKGVAGDDPAMREARTMLEAVQRRLPFMSQDLAPRRNILGEVITPTPGYLPFVDTQTPGLANFVSRFASPAAFSREVDDDVIGEMAKLSYAFSMPSQRLQGVDLTLYTNGKQDAYDRYLELTGTVRLDGKTLSQALSRVIRSPEYAKAPEPVDRSEMFNPRVKMIRAVLGEYRDAARRKILREYPEVGQAIRGLASEGTGKPEQSPVLQKLVR